MARPQITKRMAIGRVQIFREGKIFHARWRQNGERKQVSTKSHTERGAIAFAERINDELDTHEEFQVADIRTTVAVAYEHFQQKWHGWRPSTWASSGYFFTARFLPDFGTRKIGAIRQRELKVWLAQQQKRPTDPKDKSTKRCEEVSASAFNGFISNLSALWRFCVDMGYCKENILIGIGRKREPKYMDVEADALTEQQVNALLADLLASASPHGYLLAMLAVDTGMRRGELWALKWEDVDFNANQIRVDDSGDGRGTKTGNIRDVPMTTRVREALRDRRLKGQEPVPRTDIKKALIAAGRRTGIGHIHFHMLRHTAATRWYESGMSIEQVQRGLGHTTMQMTRRYMKVRQQQLRDGIAHLDDMIEGRV